MIIDFHAYIGESRLYGQKYEKAKSLVEIMDRFKIDKAVLLPTASPPVPNSSSPFPLPNPTGHETYGDRNRSDSGKKEATAK